MGNNKESPDNRLLDMATLGCVFSRHNVLKDHSHSVNEIDDAHKKKNKTKQNKNKNKKKTHKLVYVSVERVHGRVLRIMAWVVMN